MTSLPPSLGDQLVAVARCALHRATGGPSIPEPVVDAVLERPGASFVTLMLDGKLRGCIGALEPHRALVDDVRHNTRAAALSDSRFAPVSAEELERIQVEISVLTPLESLEVESESNLLAQLRPGVDGLVIACEGRRATYLPQVWELFPEPARFLESLRQKAGLPSGFWSSELEAWRFAVEKFAE